MAFIISGGASETTLQAGGGDIHLNLATPALRGESREVIIPSALDVRQHALGLVTGRTGVFSVFAVVRPVAGKDLREEAHAAYTDILKSLAGLHILRIWNHLPAINATVAGLENYQAFCVGRAEAFDQHYPTGGNAPSYPAGSALGIDDGSLVIFGIAVDAGVETHFFENPRQLPAYHYPPRYGPRPPTFSRASSSGAGISGDGSIYISGTSSVIQSETEHPFDLEGQLATTRSVLETLIAAIEEEHTPRLSLPDALGAAEFRLYIRDPADIDAATNWLKAHFPLNESNWRVVKADVCRRELLAELEISIHPGRVDDHV